MGSPIPCVLLRPSWNHTYLIQATGGRYILRIYGAIWHTLPEIQYELALLLHLERAGVSVATPIARADGYLLTPLLAPEGIRYAALFTYASGQVPTPYPIGTPEQARQFGHALAALHQAARTFTSPYTRPPHDFKHLVQQPLATLEPFLTHRPQDWAYLVTIAAEVRERLAAIAAQELEWCVIHGDPFSANATITDDLHVTWYDFDLCGPGWPVEDLAAAYGSIMLSTREAAEQAVVWQAFQEGYSSLRPVTALDLDALHVVYVASDFYITAINLTKGPFLGYAYWGSDAFLDGFLGSLPASIDRMRATPSWP